MTRVGLVLFLISILNIFESRASIYQCSESAQTLPDSQDCSVFYKCDGQQEKHKFFCPAGLVFNPQQSFCDWPDNVECNNEAEPSVTRSLVQKKTREKYFCVFLFSSTEASTTSKTSELPSTTSASSSSFSSPSSATSRPTSTETSCSTDSSEPINDEIKELRKSTCTLSNNDVEKISPNSDSNPANVKIVESLMSETKFQEIFPRANPSYTYTNFLKAVGKYPAVCANLVLCKKTLATVFAHFEQETAGLFYLEEIAKSDYCAGWSKWVADAYPCAPGKQYYGRGSKQLSWNYNYGAFSTAMFGNTETLLHHPELVADTWLNFASAFWFFVTPQPPKPSMQQVLDGSWRPNSKDVSEGRVPGFGATIMIINGGLECGSGATTQALNRQKHFRRFAEMFGVELRPGEPVGCDNMKQFSSLGSANPDIYWEPAQHCKLVSWQTAHSGLVEGQHEACRQAATRVFTYQTLPFMWQHIWPVHFLLH